MDCDKRLTFSTAGETVRLLANALVCVTADGNYSTLHTAHGDTFTLTLQLGVVERRIAMMMPEGSDTFIRIGKSLIVNRDYISYINPQRQRLILSNGHTFRHEVTASKEALKALKEYLENDTQL